MDDLQERCRKLQEAIAEQWEYELRESPEFATSIGDYRYNDRWSDLSLEHVEQQKRDLAGWLARFEAIDTAGMSEQDRLNHTLMVRNLRESLDHFQYKLHEMPLDQLDGIHLTLAQFVTDMPFASPEHYEAYVTRLRALPKVVRQVIDVLRQGARDGLLPPRYLLEKTVAQCYGIAEPAGEANAFGRPAAEMPESIAGAERQKLRRELLEAVDTDVRPAYRELAGFIRDEYAPKGRADAGIWALPGGETLYRFLVRRLTTTDLEPQAIHELGQQEVARIEDEQAAIARELGFRDLRAFRLSLRETPRLVPASRDEILGAYRGYIDQMKPRLPELFGLLPKTPLEVRPMQQYREKEAAAAEYYPGTPDGSRPGVVYVNTGDHEHRSLLGAESTAYHEALPGHHLQTSIAQTLEDLPAFRQHAYYGAYIEGWALYCERLGKDIGFYEDPYSDFGRLSDELLRAARLVLDTGVHYKRWTREQMVDYFHEHSSEDEPDIQIETDRYIVLPGQALSYKLGQMEILRLRERAQVQLGERYDVRAFHDTILDGGALPLDILSARVGAWLASHEEARLR